MKQSIWLQNHEKEVNEKRAKSFEKKEKALPLTMLIMMAIFVVLIIANGGLDTFETRISLIATVCIFSFIALYLFILMKIAKKKDVTKHTRNQVYALFETDADVEQFDSEMSATPLTEIVINAGTTMFMTTHYIGVKTNAMGDARYSFIRTKDIASFHKAITKSTTANPLKAAYFFDIRDKNHEIIMNGLADSGKQLNAVIDMLQTANPNVMVA